MGQRSADAQAGGRPMEKKKAVIEKIWQEESTAVVSQSTIGNGSSVRLYKVFDSCESPFLFLVVFIFL
jgi:hypothetical protein